MEDNDRPAQPARRDFLTKSAAVCIGVVVVLVPVGAGVATLLDPLRRKSAGSAFVLVTKLNALPEDGTPRRFEIVADRTDAWNRFPQVPVGAIYLRRSGGAQVEAFNVTCPHAGCPVEYVPGASCFLCPCHDSKFTLNGQLFAGAKSPSPRPMDSLSVEVRGGDEIWVKFENFEPGTAKKIPLT